MTAAAFSTILIRFAALALLIYGVTLLVRGVVTQSEIHQARESFAALIADQAEHGATVGNHDSGKAVLGNSFTKIVKILYAAGTGTMLAGAVLYAGSRHLGHLIARGL